MGLIGCWAMSGGVLRTEIIGLPPAFFKRVVAPGVRGVRTVSARILSTRQTVVRGPSCSDGGYFPDFTPAHQLERLTGIGPVGPMI